MQKKDLLKFFSGFFFAIIILHLFVLFLGIMPFTIRGFVFDYSFWTMGIISSCFFVVACSSIGWERKEANLISISVLIFLLSIVSASGLYFSNSKDFVFSKYSASVVNVVEKEKPKESANIDNTNETNLTYTHSIGGEKNDLGATVANDNDNNVYTAGAFSGVINLNPSSKFEKTSLGEIGETTDIYISKYNQKGEFVWGFTIGSVGADAPSLIRVDKKGSIYLTGYIGGATDFDPSDKEFILDAGIGQDGFIAKYDSAGNFIWAKKIGDPEVIPFVSNDIRFEEVVTFNLDKDENIFIAGYFEGTIEFKNVDNNTISWSSSTPKRSRDIFVVKYDKDGNYLNGINITGEGRKEPRGILIDDENNIYLSGVFNSKIIFNNSDPKKTTYTAGGNDLFLSKYDENFNYLWSKKWGSTSNDYLGRSALIFDYDGKVLLAGGVGGYVNFQGVKISNKGMEDIFWAKLDKDGNIEYAKSIGAGGSDVANSIAIDSLNNIYIAGHISGAVNFDLKNKKENSVAYSTSSGEASDAFVAKFNSSGDFIWVNSLGGDVSLKEESQAAYSITVDNLDYPIITGSFCKDINFNSTKSLNFSSNGLLDAMLIKYDPEGGLK